MSTLSHQRIRKRLESLLAEEFPLVSGTGSDVSDKIIDAQNTFRQGYHYLLSNTVPEFRESVETIKPGLRGFALEGASMAAVMLDYLSREKTTLALLLKESTRSEMILFAIGGGCAGARLKQPLSWKPEAFTDWSLFWANGYGFYQTLSSKYGSLSLPDLENHWKYAYMVGMGRSLWFKHMGNLRSIKEAIVKWEDLNAAQLWQGVATACAFTDNSSEMEALARYGQGYYHEIIEGRDEGERLKLELLNPEKEINIE